MIITPPHTPEPIRFETLLSLSWTVFRRNWIVALPPVIAMVIMIVCYAAFLGFILAATFSHGASKSMPPGFVGALVAGVLAALQIRRLPIGAILREE